MSAVLQHPGVEYLFVTLTASAGCGSLQQAWDEFQNIPREASWRKFLSIDTLGSVYSDGVTRSNMGTWNVHRHMFVAVDPARAEQVKRKISNYWVRACDKNGVASSEAAQLVQRVTSGTEWAVIDYTLDQFSPSHHKRTSPGSCSEQSGTTPGQLLLWATEGDIGSLRAYIEIERAMYKRATQQSTGIFKRAQKV